MESAHTITTRCVPSTRLIRWILPILLGIFYALGDNVALNEGSLTLHNPTLYVNMLYAVVFMVIAFVICETIAIYLIPYVNKTFFKQGHVTRKIASFFNDFSFSKSAFFRIFIIIFACWIPYTITLFPGVYTSDTSLQLIQYYGGAPMSDHNPLLDTLLFGLFSDFGKLFGSETLGLYLLIIIQTISLICLLTLTILQAKKMELGSTTCIIMLAFYMLFAFLPLVFSNLAKDTINAVLFLAFILLTSELSRTSGRVFDNKKWLISYVVIAILAGLTKKTITYILFAFLLLACIYYKKTQYFKKCIGVFLSYSIFVLLIMPKVILPLANVEPGGKQEAIATLIQQVAHDVVYDDGSMSEEDKDIVKNFLTRDYDDIPEYYSFECADPIKLREVNDDYYLSFIGLWFRKTLANPLGHFEAWLGLNDGWFGFSSSDDTAGYMHVQKSSIWYRDEVVNYVDWPTEAGSRSKAVEAVYTFVESIPGFNFLFYKSTWATFIPVFMVFISAKSKKGKLQNIYLCSPIWLSMLTLFLTPISGYGAEPTRYLLHIIVTSPFILAQLANNLYREQN